MKTDIDDLAEMFKALSNGIRLRIVIGLLEKSECNVNLMAEKLGISQPNVSQHLTILKLAGVIEGFRKGNQICYRVTNKMVSKLIRSICPQGSACENNNECKHLEEGLETNSKIKDGKCIFCDECKD